MCIRDRPLPLRLARAAATQVRDAVALRTAPPVVTAVRRERLTRLPPSVLAGVHERVVEAEAQGRAGVVVVAADARSSAREVRVANVADRAAVEAALTRHGFRPGATRVSLHEGLPDAEGDPVAVAFVGEREPTAIRAVSARLAGRLAVGGVLIVDAEGRERKAAVTRAVEGLSVRLVQRTRLHVIRER